MNKTATIRCPDCGTEHTLTSLGCSCRGSLATQNTDAGMSAPSLERVELPPYDATCEAIRAYAVTLESGAQYTIASLKGEKECRERQLLAEMKVSAGLRSELKAMTEDRNLWRDEHNGDCPNGVRVENLEAELQSLMNRMARIEGKEHLQTIDERDAAEESLSQAYYLIQGESPQWSNIFGYKEALQDIDDAQRRLRAEIKQHETTIQSLRERQERALACLRCSEDKKHAKMAIGILTRQEPK